MSSGLGILYGDHARTSAPPLIVDGWKSQARQYYIEYPYNCNVEYTVFVAATPETIAWCEERSKEASGDPDRTFARITRGHAAYRGIRAPRQELRNIGTGVVVHILDRLIGGMYGDFEMYGRSDKEIFDESARQLARAIEGSESHG